MKTQIPFTHEDDCITAPVTLADQEKFRTENKLEIAHAYVQGPLNDTAVYELPGGFTHEGEPYRYVVLGAVFDTPWSDVIYIQLTNHEDVLDKWIEVENSDDER